MKLHYCILFTLLQKECLLVVIMLTRFLSHYAYLNNNRHSGLAKSIQSLLAFSLLLAYLAGVNFGTKEYQLTELSYSTEPIKKDW